MMTWLEPIRRNRRPMVLATYIVSIGACVDSSDPTYGFAVRDSGAVVIAENGPEAIASLPINQDLSAPRVVLGRMESDDAQYLFHRVLGATRLSDGRLVVVNAGTSEIRWYSSEGEHSHSIGRRGSGPGEFDLLLTLMRSSGDSIVIFDMIQSRFTFLTPEGAIVRTVEVRSRLSGFQGLLSDGRAVTAEPAFPRFSGEDLVNLPMIVRVVDLEGGRADTIARVGQRQEMQSVDGERVVMTPVPFTAHASVAVGNDEIFITDGVQPEIRVYDSAGRVVKVIRVSASPAPLDRSEYDAFVQSRIAEAPADRQQEVRRLFGQMTAPTTKPYYDQLMVAGGGRVWARHFTPDTKVPRLWTVFDPPGRAVARLEVPPGLRITEIGVDYVLGVFADDIGVEYVHQYRLGI